MSRFTKQLRSATWCLCLWGCMLQGCYHYRVIPAGASSATDYEGVTVYSYWWGIKEPTVIPDNCHCNGASNVRVTFKFHYLLVSIITLGVVVPMKIEWKCAKDLQPGQPCPPLR